MMQRCGWSIEQVSKQLAGEGGLAGLSGIPGGDVRDLEKAIAEGSEAAALALDVFVYEVKKTIGAYAAVMGGIEAIAFTGGIGENSAGLRARCCQGLEFLGVHLDAELNKNGGTISSADSKVLVMTLQTNEELIVARRAYRRLTPEK